MSFSQAGSCWRLLHIIIAASLEKRFDHFRSKAYNLLSLDGLEGVECFFTLVFGNTFPRQLLLLLLFFGFSLSVRVELLSSAGVSDLSNLIPHFFSLTCISIYLFGVLCHFQNCTGHITVGSWKDRGNQYIQLDKVLYCELLTNSKQLPTVTLEVEPWTEPMAAAVGVLPLCNHGHLASQLV